MLAHVFPETLSEAGTGGAMTKGEVLEAIAIAYTFTKQQAKNFDPLLDAL